MAAREAAEETYKGIIERLYAAPPGGSVVVCLDEMGSEGAKSFPGQCLVHAKAGEDAEGRLRPAGRARQEIDYGRRGKGYIFGAFIPAVGEAFTRPYDSRRAANWAGFQEHV